MDLSFNLSFHDPGERGKWMIIRVQGPPSMLSTGRERERSLWLYDDGLLLMDKELSLWFLFSPWANLGTYMKLCRSRVYKLTVHVLYCL